MSRDRYINIALKSMNVSSYEVRNIQLDIYTISDVILDKHLRDVYANG